MITRQQTIEALEQSIAKWKQVAAGTAASRGGDDCPLCKLFHDCDSCPVVNCISTPYIDFYFSASTGRDGDRLWAKTLEAKKAALAEVAFLEKVLRKYRGKK